MRIFLLRHGETDWVSRKLYQGSSDVPLNARGLVQAKRVGQAMKRERPFVIYCSELKRVRQTAEAIARTLKQKLIVDSRLNEISFGKWEGHPYDKIKKRYPRATQLWYEAHPSSCPTGGESLRSLRKRVGSFVHELIQEQGHREGACVLVTHGGPIRMMLLELLKIPLHLFWTIRIDPASISAVHMDRKRMPEFALLNSQAHLDGYRTEFFSRKKGENR